MNKNIYLSFYLPSLLKNEGKQIRNLGVILTVIAPL
jgi:hypothetical protein